MVTILNVYCVETALGYYAQRALCSRPSLVTGLNVRFARDRPWLLGSTYAMLNIVPEYYYKRILCSETVPGY